MEKGKSADAKCKLTRHTRNGDRELRLVCNVPLYKWNYGIMVLLTTPCSYDMALKLNGSLKVLSSPISSALLSTPLATSISCNSFLCSCLVTSMSFQRSFKSASCLGMSCAASCPESPRNPCCPSWSFLTCSATACTAFDELPESRKESNPNRISPHRSRHLATRSSGI